MKNLFVLPTDKPSNLTIRYKTKELMYSYKKFVNQQSGGITLNINQHIYITNSERIKLSNWACHKSVTNDKYQLVKCTISNKESIQEHWNKIILTTDPDLIKDGVQAIDDDFLECFVKNPSWERVEVSFLGAFNKVDSYKIITPKEDAVLEKANEIGSFAEKKLLERIDNFQNVEFKDGVFEGAKWQMDKQDDFIMGFLEFIEGTYDYSNIHDHWYLNADTSKTYSKKQLLKVYLKSK